MLEFKQKIEALRPGTYGLSFFTLINCGTSECSAADDMISVKVKDGIDGEFREVYNISERSSDTRWENHEIDFQIEHETFFVSKLSLRSSLVLLIKNYI